MSYLPIESYGLIGNMRTAALVGRDGSIDWLCFPHFDSPSVFAAILDDEKGGCFRIAPEDRAPGHKQHYWPDTNVLVSRFLSAEGVGEIQDFMPVHRALPEGDPDQIVRRVRVSRGRMSFVLECRPAFDYARAPHEVRIVDGGALFISPRLSLALATQDVKLEARDGAVVARFLLEEGAEATFVLRHARDGSSGAPVGPEESAMLFERTVEFWRDWLAQCRYAGRWRNMVYRSALTLKLLTFEPTGAIVSAPTTSLPNQIGGQRNWDFRYTWIRDASFTLYALLRLGFSAEAKAFTKWLDGRFTEDFDPERGPLQIMYGIDGRTDLEEVTLDHLKGYRGSRPVRIGNRAHRTLQLDIYGELIDSIYLYNKYGSPISSDLWRRLRTMVDWVCENWSRPDEGIWEVRTKRRHFVYSKVMCWVALDRGLRLARKRSLPADEARWLRVRNEIYEDVLEKGWNPERGAFVQSYGSDCLDGAMLILPLVFFLASDDPKMISTLNAISRPPDEGGLVSDGLVFRFQPTKCGDGVSGSEGTFNMCSFWLVEALTRAGRTHRAHLDRARLLFERMLGHANHLGLFSEQTGVCGEALGNFPQAFTHLGLISAAVNLDRALNDQEIEI